MGIPGRGRILHDRHLFRCVGGPLLQPVFHVGGRALAATPVWHVVVWSVPGVLVGSTVGSRIGQYLPGKFMEKALAVIFGLVGLLVLGVELFAS